LNVFTLNCFDEEFNDPKESLILSSCGHPCLRVWVGGFRPDLAMDNFCPTLYFVPPRICPGKGVVGKQSSWKAFPTVQRIFKPS
jgi:hypothetical protein